jgi:hypothetical protein
VVWFLKPLFSVPDLFPEFILLFHPTAPRPTTQPPP